MAETLSLELVREAGDWPADAAASRLAEIARAVARHTPVAGSAAILLSDDAGVRSLNARFRGRDRPTNVLSFPSGEAPRPDAHLGDVALAAETVRAEAAREGRPFDHHFAHLVIHGILHLVGYDHEDDRQAETMERLEARILAELAIPDPYEEAPATGS